MWKNMVQSDNRWQYSTTKKRCDLHTEKQRQVYRPKLRICNTYCFSTAKMFTRTRLSVVTRTLPVLFRMGTDLPVPFQLSQRGTNAVRINVNTSSCRLRHLLPYIPNLFAQHMPSSCLNTQQYASFSIQTRRKASRILSRIHIAVQRSLL